MPCGKCGGSKQVQVTKPAPIKIPTSPVTPVPPESPLSQQLDKVTSPGELKVAIPRLQPTSPAPARRTLQRQRSASDPLPSPAWTEVPKKGKRKKTRSKSAPQSPLTNGWKRNRKKNLERHRLQTEQAERNFQSRSNSSSGRSSRSSVSSGGFRFSQRPDTRDYVAEQVRSLRRLVKRFGSTAALTTQVANSCDSLSERDCGFTGTVKSFYDSVYKVYGRSWRANGHITSQQLTAGLAAICRARVLQAVLSAGKKDPQERGHCMCILAAYQCYLASQNRPNEASTIRMLNAYFADKKQNRKRSDFEANLRSKTAAAIEAAMNSQPQVDLNSAAFRSFLTSRGNATECGDYLRNKVLKKNHRIQLRK